MCLTHVYTTTQTLQCVCALDMFTHNMQTLLNAGPVVTLRIRHVGEDDGGDDDVQEVKNFRDVL